MTPDYQIETAALAALSKDCKGKRAIFARVRYGYSKTECQDHYYEEKNFKDSEESADSSSEESGNFKIHFLLVNFYYF